MVLCLNVVVVVCVLASIKHNYHKELFTKYTPDRSKKVKQK